MNEIYHWMEQIKERNSDLVTKDYLGSTYENRPIYYFKIGLPSNEEKKIIWMDCGIHAREWISIAFCQWFIKEIAENHRNDPQLKKILHNIDFYIVPVLNIDGFIYSWTTDRLWRKSRSVHDNGSCYGVDLNRNFDSKWCSIGASTNCNTSTFCGSGPASEPEVFAVSELVKSLKSNILCFLTMHSYGQLILLPYGYTKNVSVNHEEMLTVAEKAAANLKEKHGTEYRVGSTSHILYSNSGSSRDWAADLGINFSYTFELRDKSNGSFGFELPEDQIKPTCEETMAGVMTIVDYLNEKHFNRHRPVDEYATEFHHLAIESTWNEATLLDQFHLGLLEGNQDELGKSKKELCENLNPPEEYKSSGEEMAGDAENHLIIHYDDADDDGPVSASSPDTDEVETESLWHD
ncbi:carboxypeptidase O-like [Rhinophrynus dorsalis]